MSTHWRLPGLLTVSVWSLAVVAPAGAAVTYTTGAGSAVFRVDSGADFESVNAVTDNPYLEGGMAFSRSGLGSSNNDCGYAGCTDHLPFSGFTGNFMYSYSVTGGYFQIKATDGKIFEGLEFVIGSGFNNNPGMYWSASLNNVSVGVGREGGPSGRVVGFSGAGGFDTLQFFDEGPGFFSGSAPAFDTVRAQFAGQAAPVPEPATWALMIAGFGLVGSTMRARHGVLLRQAII